MTTVTFLNLIETMKLEWERSSERSKSEEITYDSLFWTDIFIKHFLLPTSYESNTERDDLLFFVKREPITSTTSLESDRQSIAQDSLQNIEVYRRESKRLPIGNTDVDWIHTVYLNTIVHHFTNELNIVVFCKSSDNDIQIISRNSQRVYATPSFRTCTEKEEFCFPYLIFNTFNDHNDLRLEKDQFLGFELTASHTEQQCESGGVRKVVIFDGCISHDTILNGFEAHGRKSTGRKDSLNKIRSSETSTRSGESRSRRRTRSNDVQELSHVPSKPNKPRRRYLSREDVSSQVRSLLSKFEMQTDKISDRQQNNKIRIFDSSTMDQHAEVTFSIDNQNLVSTRERRLVSSEQDSHDDELGYFSSTDDAGEEAVPSLTHRGHESHDSLQMETHSDIKSRDYASTHHQLIYVGENRKDPYYKWNNNYAFEMVRGEAKLEYITNDLTSTILQVAKEKSSADTSGLLQIKRESQPLCEIKLYLNFLAVKCDLLMKKLIFNDDFGAGDEAQGAERSLIHF